jgi:ubiquinone/menaquinone biosynthesis C-methylase UbiE
MDCSVRHPYVSGCFSDKEDDVLRPGGLDLTRRVVRCAGFGAGQRILDVGCGDGFGTQVLRRQGCAAMGLDVSPSTLRTTAARLPGLPLLAANVEKLPLADASLDGILAECSLSLAGYDKAALIECHRTLRPGGRLAITDVFAREPKVGGELPSCLGHLLERDDILARLVSAGFQVSRWEDHSAVLKTFMARLIFAAGSPNALWGNVPNQTAACYGEALRQRRPGYFLLVANKTTRST